MHEKEEVKTKMKNVNWILLGIMGIIIVGIGVVVSPISVMAIRYVDMPYGDNVPFVTFNKPYSALGSVLSLVGALTAIIGFLGFCVCTFLSRE